MVSLFSSTLISSTVQSAIPAGFHLRPLESTDYEKGFISTLSELTTTGSFTKDLFQERFDYLLSKCDTYYVLVLEDLTEKRIAAAGTVFVERKFVHAAGLVGHIEDIVVAERYRKLKFGKVIIDALKSIARDTGCYKVILDCSEQNVGFYEKCGFTKKEVEMALYFSQL